MASCARIWESSQCVFFMRENEEEWLIQDCLRLVKGKLCEPSTKPSTIIKCLAFSIFSELSGYKAEFAYIHAVKLAQYGSLAEKKMGYLACAFLLRECDSLSVLLVNTIFRDLTSKNMYVVAMALSASCHLVSPDQVTVLLPVLEEKLKHPSEYVRSKAVIVLHHFCRVSPQLCLQYANQVKVMVGDRDPGVVAHVLQFLIDVAEDLPGVVMDVMSALVQIQNQILDGKLPHEYTYKGLHAPWMQISIIRLLQYLQEPSMDIYMLIQKTLQNAMPQMQNYIGSAIVCECIATLVKHKAGDEMLASALLCVVDLMGSTSSNLRYEGLSLLEKVLEQYRLPLSPAQQDVVLSSLCHPDQAMKRRTLSLLCTMAEAHNVEIVCTQVADYVRDHCAHNPYIQHDLISRALALTDRFQNSQTHWHIAALIRLLPLAQDKQAKAIQRRIQLTLLAGSGNLEDIIVARSKVLHILAKYAESKTVSTSVIEVYVWCLSQFCGAKVDDGQQVLEKLVSLGCKVLRNQEPSNVSQGIQNLLISIIHSASHVAEKCGTTISSLEELLQEIMKSHLADAYLRHTCLELLASLPHISVIHRALQRSIRSEKQFDFTLSFVDKFVCESLAANAMPYQPKLLHIAVPVPEMTSLPSDSMTAPPDTVALPSTCPSPVSSGTSSIIDFPRSESFSSEDSKSWSLRSPQKEDILAKPLWSREGRTKNVDPFVYVGHKDQLAVVTSDSEMQHLASLLFNRQEPGAAGEETSQGDPLDELLNKDFQKLSVLKSERS
ncbi:AP-4 complex subunit epsilon-1-like isoform X2 [Zootermopsis nevadensis]|uniref:AP-4 complex subunit epsilon-1-like isoform X2 n=1 Tax=Zootermopsis nevadensis TaxID=136037 RepID=UPI000B8E62DB|nr:AP-4 complex subunit epsilon-1-like isoform X2 [Zootermopsis nevadensis]